jgi:hypothetical protein
MHRLIINNNHRVYTSAIQSNSNSNGRSFMLANKKRYTLYLDKEVAIMSQIFLQEFEDTLFLHFVLHIIVRLHLSKN